MEIKLTQNKIAVRLNLGELESLLSGPALKFELRNEPLYNFWVHIHVSKEKSHFSSEKLAELGVLKLNLDEVTAKKLLSVQIKQEAEVVLRPLNTSGKRPSEIFEAILLQVDIFSLKKKFKSKT